MIIFQTGASGYIGGAVAEALLREGHTVQGLAHSDQSAAVLESRGIQVVRGGLFDSGVLRQAAGQADAVVHTASTSGPDMGAADRTAVEAILDGLDGTHKAFVYTQGAWHYGDTGEGSPMRAGLPIPCRSSPGGQTSQNAFDPLRRGGCGALWSVRPTCSGRAGAS